MWPTQETLWLAALIGAALFTVVMAVGALIEWAAVPDPREGDAPGGRGRRVVYRAASGRAYVVRITSEEIAPDPSITEASHASVARTR